ncbi:AzlD domain-containing protein, partial [Moraxella boevrei]
MQNTQLYFILSVLSMAIVTFIIRLMPTFLPKKLLNSPLLLAVNKGLPLAVMTLLILTSLTWLDKNQQFSLSPLLTAQILALILVLISYHIWKQMFVSMIIG